ncbi:MAG: response regulator transcription factor [Paludibacter sp.]|nr:response regulator transcription factor [Paludibacter sp.]
MNERSLKIAVAEPSAIIRSGVTAVLKRIQGIHVQPFEISSPELLLNYIRMHKPDVLIINPGVRAYPDINKLKDESENNKLKCFALVTGLIDESILKTYDDHIGLYDPIDLLKEKLEKLFEPSDNNQNNETESLSQREKEILTCVVKGMTNKEIAEQLFLSTHTVITHRRNIARKLEIHSTAGLTIYAIVNKLVELDEIKKDL